MFFQGFILCACVAFVSADQRASRLVATTQGIVRGYQAPGGHYEFLGIPYATEPTGANKFRPPLPPPTWIQPFEAVQSNITCFLNMDPNCLVTNIYVPDTRERNLPVVVHVHGGAFAFGYANMATATNFVRIKNVIVLNFNYRVAAKGFICLGTKDIPGNAGMKDQVALLRWVQRNIANFGGNPNDVTVHGWSAGAAAADLLLSSKIARGLFHKIIIDSGSSTASYTIQLDPLTNAKRIARHLNFHNVDNITALEEFYKTASHELLQSAIAERSPNGSTIYAPCVESDIGEEMFLDDAPINILTRGDFPKMPMLIGIADGEGTFQMPYFEIWRDRMNNKFSDFLPEDLAFPSELVRDIVARQLKQFYFGNKLVDEETVLDFVNYFGDSTFNYGVAKSVKLQLEAGNNQVYLYEYSYSDERDSYITYTNVRVAAHCAQTHSVMDQNDEEQFILDRRMMKAVMRDLYFNFIKTGKPVPDGSPYPAWPPVQRDLSPYMSLNRNLKLRQSLLKNRDDLWDEIYSRYYHIPVPPSVSQMLK